MDSNTMETSGVLPRPPRDDITFHTEETDNISEISTVITHAQPNTSKDVPKKHHNVPKVDKKQSTGKDPKKSKKIMVPQHSRFQIMDNQKKLMWGLIVLLAIIVGLLAGLLLKDKTEDVITIPAQPQKPTLSPSLSHNETLRVKLEYLLADYKPLDERTMTWLTEESTWNPDELEDYVHFNNQTLNYLWIERYAMGLLYFSTNGPEWKRNDDWMSNDLPVCQWYSMEYNKCPGPIKNLVLYLNKMKGSLPSVIFELTKLEKIHLARNGLTGTLPDSIGNMKNLKFVDLASNWLNGTIPGTIQKMTNLEKLYLPNNDLVGPIPEEIGNNNNRMKNLEVLSWWGNYLNGTIPASIGNMTRLTDLSLSENVLSGTIPASIGDLTRLSRLSLHTNYLSGTIPETIVDMRNLQWLSLYENYHLYGSFPELPTTVTHCFIGSCFDDITNAVASRCIFFDSCE